MFKCLKHVKWIQISVDKIFMFPIYLFWFKILSTVVSICYIPVLLKAPSLKNLLTRHWLIFLFFIWIACKTVTNINCPLIKQYFINFAATNTKVNNSTAHKHIKTIHSLLQLDIWYIFKCKFSLRNDLLTIEQLISYMYIPKFDSSLKVMYIWRAMFVLMSSKFHYIF